MKALNNLSLISIPINESLTQYAGKVYLCGGAVRDYIMDPNIIPKDYDLVVDMEDGGIKFAEDICKFYGVYKENSNPVTYNKFKTAKFVIHGIEFESVCPRKESYDSNNRKPSVEKSTLYEDAIRRDLTINALYYNLTTNEIIDFVGGVNDIKNKILKTPLDPFTTFTDDPLRMLRAFRFNARFNDYVLDDNILDAVRSCEPRISIVSKERVQDELIKILSVTDSVHLAKILSIMMECGLFNNIIPELVSLKNMPQGIVHTHRNVWEHTLNAIKNTKKDPILRLAVLLHDVGKISTMKYIDKDNIKYPNHHIEGESIVKERLKDLKFTNKQIKLIANAVKMHMSFNTIYFKYNNFNSSIQRVKNDTILVKNEILDEVIDLDFCFDVFKCDVMSLDDDKRLIKDSDLDIAYKILYRIKSLDNLIKQNKDYLTGDDIIDFFKVSDYSKIPLYLKTYNNDILINYPEKHRLYFVKPA